MNSSDYNCRWPCSFPKCTFRLEDNDPVTEKKESSRPCVLPCRLFTIFLQPLRILSSLLDFIHLNCFSEQSTTSGFKNKPLASLYSQSSGAGCFCMTSNLPCFNQSSTAGLGLTRSLQHKKH
uniref:Uncharacterized protein n=1 Tax=Stegastes partitus TaxID=144197 RepID=A0A3B5ACX7_9TELE